MTDALFPATDGGVLVQFVLLAAVATIALLAVRKHRDLRLLIVGLTVLAFGLMALRAVH